MSLFGNKYSKRDDAPFLAPEPEGPDEISERAERRKRGNAGAAKRWLLEKSGLEKYSPAKRLIIASVATAEIGMMGLTAFTDANLPAEWLIGAVIPLLALLTHKSKKDETTRTPPRA